MSYVKVRLVCMGLRETNKGFSQFWCGPDDKSTSWPKFSQPVTPGAVFEFGFKDSYESGIIAVGGADRPRYVGREDSERVAGWAAEHEAAQMLRSSESLAKNDKKKSLVCASLLPLRHAMDGLTMNADRAAFVAMVTAELYRPLTKEEKGK